MDWTPVLHALIAMLAQAFAGGHRAGMPWWGGFDPRAWDRSSVLDAVAPLAVCIGLFWAVR